MMKITLVSPFDPKPPVGTKGSERVGGVERVFAQVSQNLAHRGHDVTLLCSTSGVPHNVYEDGVFMVRRPRRATVLQVPVTQLARSIPTDADVVHVAATYPFTTSSVLRRAHGLGIPSVLDFHFEPSPSSLLGRAAAAVYRRVGPRSYPLAGRAIVRSMAYGHSVPSLASVPADRWRVVPNGIDPTRFKADGPARAGDYILFVGRLVPYKGLDVLLRAMAIAGTSTSLLIAGEGPLGPALRDQARNLGIDVEFLGRVPDSDLPALYRGARVTVLPSINAQESFGITLVESMACGTPVIASQLPGVAEVAAVGGLLAEPGNATSLAQCLRQALAPEGLAGGAALSARVHAAYSWDAVTNGLEAVYAELTQAESPFASAQRTPLALSLRAV